MSDPTQDEPQFLKHFDVTKLLWETDNRTSLCITLNNTHGALQKVLSIFQSNKIDCLRVQSRPTKFIVGNKRTFEFELDFYGRSSDSNVKSALSEVNTFAASVRELDAIEVPWFPAKIDDFDHIGKKVLREGDGI